MSEIQEAEVVAGSQLPAKTDKTIPLPLVEAKGGPLTPQQARAVEVTEALLPAYQKASTLEMTDAEIEAIMAPFPDSVVEIRPHDGLIYIPHIHISDRLNRVFKPGKWALVQRRHWLEGATMYGEYVLLVRGCYVGESIGGHPYQPNNPKVNYSDTLESTAAEALRRIAGKRLSCGSQVWNPDYARTWVDTYAKRGIDGKWFKKSNAPAAKPSPPPAAKPPPSAPAAPPAPAAKAETAEEKKNRWLSLCVQAGGGRPEFARELFIEAGWIMDNEGIEAISDTHIPKTRADAAKILDEIKARAGVAEPPPENAPAEMPDNETRLHVDGVIDNVSKKEGTNKKGKPWTLYGIKIGEAYYNTFNHDIGNAAHEAKGKQARVFYEQTERGMNCIALEVDGVEYPTPEVPV